MKAALQERLRLQDRFLVIQEKMDALESKYQTRSLSTKIWPPNNIQDNLQRSKANLLYAFLMICFVVWTANEFMARIISSIREPIFESTYEKESFKFPVVTICGSKFMSRNHSFPFEEDGFGCTFYDHSDPDDSVPCSSKLVEDLYWSDVLTDYNPPCVIFNHEAEQNTNTKEEIGLDVWVVGRFGGSESDDDLWSELTTYSVFLSETDLDNPKHKNPGYFVTNTIAQGFAGYRISKAVNTGSSSVYSANLISQVPGGNALEILFDVDDDVQYLKKTNPWANSYLIFGSMVGMFGIVTILYNFFNEHLFYKVTDSEDIEVTTTEPNNESSLGIPIDPEASASDQMSIDPARENGSQSNREFEGIE